MNLARTYFKQWGACVVLALVACTSLSHATEPMKTTPPTAAAKVAPKWETDEALRQGMDSIRKSMAASQNGIKSDTLLAQDYQKLAQEVNKQLAGSISTRKLNKEAEIAFHLVVMIDINQCIEQMLSSRSVKLQHVGALGVLQILRNYGQYFQHPGWPLA